MVYVVVIIGALAGSLLVFWVTGVPVSLLLAVVRWGLERAGVRFDDAEDDDPNGLRMIAVSVGLRSGLGILLSVAVGGWFVFARALWAPAITAALVGAIVSGRLARHGFPGMSVLPALGAGGIAGAVLGCCAALVSS